MGFCLVVSTAGSRWKVKIEVGTYKDITLVLSTTIMGWLMELVILLLIVRTWRISILTKPKIDKS